MTREELIQIALNESRESIRNGEIYVLSNEEHLEAAENWADFRLSQISKEESDKENLAKRSALLERLGLTEEEAKLLLS
jgi:chemotaxis response regulator CheB